MEEFRLDVPIRRARKPRYGGYEPKATRKDYLAELGVSEAEACLMRMTDEEVAFCCEMVNNGLDKVKAYRTVYQVSEVDQKTYRKISGIIKRDDVRQLLRLGVSKRMGEVMDNLDSQLLDTYCQRAFYDIADFHDAQGFCLPLDQIPEEKRVAIDRIDTRYYGKDGDVRSVNYVLANRDNALKVLGEYMEGIRPSKDADVTTISDVGSEGEEDMADRYAKMTDEELRAEMRRLG